MEPRDLKQDAKNVWVREAMESGASRLEAEQSFDWWWNPRKVCLNEARSKVKCSVQCKFCLRHEQKSARIAE